MGMARTPTRCCGSRISRRCLSPRSVSAVNRARLGPPHVLWAEVGDGIATQLTEHPVDFAGQNLQRTIHARLAPRGQAVQRGAPDHDGLRTQRERLDDVGTAAEAAVDENGEALADRV